MQDTTHRHCLNPIGGGKCRGGGWSHAGVPLPRVLICQDETLVFSHLGLFSIKYSYLE